MATVYMLTTADGTTDRYNRRDFERLSAAAQSDIHRAHSLVDTPDVADIILFVGSSYPDHRDVRAHPLVRRYRRKSFLFHSDDYIIPFLPGVYVNIMKRWHSPGRTAPGFYLQQYSIPFGSSLSPCDYLFCFIGSTRSHPVRSRLMSLKHSRGYLEDTSAALPADQKAGPFFMVGYGQDHRTHYGDIITRSKFVLCPRGYACSTWRLFETMKAGRVPVIISDQWVPPVGPEWSTFSLRVKQSQIAEIPEMLERCEPNAGRMGQLARTAWEDWFSPEASFHRIVEWCLELNRSERHILGDVLPYAQLLRPFFLRHVLLPEIKKEGLRRLAGSRR